VIKMSKGIIYYTDNRLGDTLFSACQKYILAADLPIVSVSLKPIKFGQNIVIKGEPGYPTMVNQIVTALEASTADYVFLCEHDILYHKSHFDFLPPDDDVYYYNMNNWRWDYPSNIVIRYDGLTSLSQLCAKRVLVLKHYKARRDKMKEVGLEKFRMNDPHLARLWGYEPGRKKRRNGAFLEEKSDHWSSNFPNIDIRHSGSFSLPKVKLKDFHHKPTGWVETTIDQITDWNLKELLP
jgi:hypothetical protein